MDAYFDIFSGISGNMVLGALVDLGLDVEKLKNELEKLGLADEYKIEVNNVEKEGIGATYLKVNLLEKESHSHHSNHTHKHDSKDNQDTNQHDHHHSHGRNLSDIKEIINNSKLSSDIKEKSKKIFTNLAKAEAQIHGEEIEQIHFHEVGAVDAIVDIVGSVIGLKLLGIERIFASRIHTGNGFVKCDHGWMPVPAPATMELLKDIPVYSKGIEAELVTPTGAAIIATLAEEFGPRPEMEIKSTGYGAGSRDLSIPNLLRINLGEIQAQKKNTVKLIEANIDDMNPEYYQFIMEQLLKEGALDVFITPIQMKKNRPGTKLSVLAKGNEVKKLANIVLRESTSIGVRILGDIERMCLDREIKKVNTQWGRVKVKLAKNKGNIINIAPEYEDCQRIARENNIPLKKVYQVVKKKF